MIRNELDIVEFFVRHTLSFVDKLILLDHQSTDGTRQILLKLAEETKAIELYRYTAIEYDQEMIMNRLMISAFEEGKADLVIPIDCDEIMVTENDSFDPAKIRAALESLPHDQALSVEYFLSFRFDQEKYLVEPGDSYHRETKHEGLQKVIIPRTVYENHKKMIALTKGNHFLVTCSKDGTKTPIPSTPIKTIHYNHFTLRSVQQRTAKYILGWLTRLATHGPFTHLSPHTKAYFDRIKQDNSFGLDVPPQENSIVFQKMEECPVALKYANMAKPMTTLSLLMQFSETLAVLYADAATKASFENSALFVIPYNGEDEAILYTIQSIRKNNYPLSNVVCITYKSPSEEIQKRCRCIRPDQIAEIQDPRYIACVICYPGDYAERFDIFMTAFVRSHCDIILAKNNIFQDLDPIIYYDKNIAYQNKLFPLPKGYLQQRYKETGRISSSGMNAIIMNSWIFSQLITYDRISKGFNDKKLYEAFLAISHEFTVYTIGFPIFHRKNERFS